ncbi:peptide chain release factor 2 [Patescibacteria group bacterium]
MEIFEEKIKELRLKFREFADAFDFENREKTLKYLEKETQKSNFWNNKKEAAKISQELADLKEDISKINFLDKEIKDLEELNKIADESMRGELEKKVSRLQKELDEEKRKTFLSGKYDKGNAILSIYSGAGGQDAQDWATMLLRMYQRYCERKGLKHKILSQSFGEAGGPEGRIGTKSVTIEIRGKYTFGLLKRETGVHRLVRISPFSAQSLRHTSFVLIEVLPEIAEEDEKEIAIKPEDIKIDFYSASGPGGQYVNKRETAVRITHLSTGQVATCQSERTQGENRKRAMKMLMAKIYRLLKENRKKELSEIKGDKISVGWGSQIRNYVLHPYKLVKDLRTNVEIKNPEEVLDGGLESFIEAEIKLADVCLV